MRDHQSSIIKIEDSVLLSYGSLIQQMINYLRSGLFVFQHFHRLFLRETETRNTGSSENLEGAGQGRLLEERVAAIQ